MKYGYICPGCGPFDSEIPADNLGCRCGRIAKRNFQVSFDIRSARVMGGWDPVVGDYVANKNEWLSKLHEGQDRESEKLNMDVVLKTCDSRDNEGLAELHGWKDREADLENTHRVQHNRANA